MSKHQHWVFFFANQYFLWFHFCLNFCTCLDLQFLIHHYQRCAQKQKHDVGRFIKRLTHQFCAEMLSLVRRLDPERHKERKQWLTQRDLAALVLVVISCEDDGECREQTRYSTVGYVQADKCMNTTTRYYQRAGGASVSLNYKWPPCVGGKLVFENRLILDPNVCGLIIVCVTAWYRMGWCHLSTHIQYCTS